MSLRYILEDVRGHLKSMEKSRRKARQDARVYSNQGSALLEGWEHGRDIGLYTGKVRMGYIYKSLRQLESEGK